MIYRSGSRTDSSWLHGLMAVLLAMACSGPALAQSTATQSHKAMAPQDTVAIKLEQFKVIKEASGKEALAEAKTVKPGDIVEYRATYTNRDGKPIKGLVATLPIPAGMIYLPKSATPANDKAEAATQGGEYSREPLMRQVRVNGKPQTEPVPYSQYRSLRWQIGQLPAGGEYVVSARTQVEGPATSSTAEKVSASIPAAVNNGTSR